MSEVKLVFLLLGNSQKTKRHYCLIGDRLLVIGNQNLCYELLSYIFVWAVLNIHTGLRVFKFRISKILVTVTQKYPL